MMDEAQDSGRFNGLAGAEAPEPDKPSRPDGGIPSADKEAMMTLLQPMIDKAYSMSGAEIASAMKGFYATSESNCAWYAYGLRWVMPPMLATIGSDKPGFRAAWGMSEPSDSDGSGEADETGTGSSQRATARA